jgi:hypothetical protein
LKAQVKDYEAKNETVVIVPFYWLALRVFLKIKSYVAVCAVGVSYSLKFSYFDAPSKYDLSN